MVDPGGPKGPWPPKSTEGGPKYRLAPPSDGTLSPKRKIKLLSLNTLPGHEIKYFNTLNTLILLHQKQIPYLPADWTRFLNF